MYDWNGKRPSVLPTTRRGVWKRLGRAVLTKLLGVPWPVRVGFLLSLLVLLTLLGGCAMQSPPSTPPRNPQPPQLREPLPQESYLSKAQKLIDSWLQRVTGM